MNFQNPNFAWYSSKSKAARVSPRCPIASSEFCPRYYSCMWLLSQKDYITKIRREDVERLDKKWQSFQPLTAEDDAMVMFSTEKSRFESISRFCPEVSYNIFGVFATGLSRYGDEYGKEFAYRKLTQHKVDSEDPRWEWMSIVPLHYTECIEYSLFSSIASGTPKKHAKSRDSLTPKVRWQILARDNFTCQYCGRKPPEVILQVDHRISVNDGGKDEQENLITSYRDCNSGKGATSITDSQK